MNNKKVNILKVINFKKLKFFFVKYFLYIAEIK